MTVEKEIGDFVKEIADSPLFQIKANISNREKKLNAMKVLFIK